MENKTLSHLNSKVWYRFIKVSYLFFFLIIILITNGLMIDDGIGKLDLDKSMIYCTQKDKRILTATQAGVLLSNIDFQNGFDYEKYFEKDYNENNIKNIFKACYDIDVDVKIKNGESLTSEEIFYARQKYNIKGVKIETLFDIKPVYTYTEFIKYFLIGNTIIILFFWLLRGTFYYIVLGKFRPEK